ncbi:MarR family transcriptional regulator [Cryobacterium sp.]|jgi:DNA-binding MarR family transcriptional regulator|uniref:MarR family winged helix-turn-helix transcriptional regulator n=1 Tax=Cryobacterium sp. TaxID=1926290 RepID=UPI002614CCEA|nr:MarR family transcriptional regulator [Cryobacterium sp.]MCU1447194.1 MarR family transcriptional regulator [Cryobacterium sp.]
MDEPEWLSADELAAWKALAGVLFLLPAALDSQLQRDSDLTMAGYMVLVMLSEREDHCMRMTELAASSNTSQSRLSRIVARLEAAGYATRRMAPDDRRAVLATLTDAGMAKLVAAAPGHVAQVRRLVFDRLTPAQVESLNEVARALTHADDPANCELST